MNNLFDFKADFDEWQEMSRLLRRLPDRIEGRLLNNASAAGARVVAKHWRKLAPTKRLKKTKVVTDKRAARAVGVKGRMIGVSLVGIRPPESKLAHLFEFGTQERFTKDGQSRGRMPMRPFMRPGLDSAANEARQKMAENLSKGLAREAEKARRQGY